ncbi:MAG: CoA transferase [Myxococcales bacterium]|nr:CoA transferase [Myxococcales bacterium]
MRPLAGMRVLDLADEKGELCGRLLADLGADVIRVEPPGGAASRRLPPFAPDGGTSLYFAVRNAGKRSVALDVESVAGRERLHGLLAAADVCVESFAPGFLTANDLDPAALVERTPGLVLVSISDFGQTGPYRDHRGTDAIGFAMGGLMHRAGIFEKPPLVAPGALAYDAAGVTAAYAALLAFWKRLATGRGQHVDVSVMESVANLSDWALPSYSVMQNAMPRAGAGIYTLYRCADGFIRMIILVEHHWRALLDWIGNPEALRDPALNGFIARLLKMDTIVPVIEGFFRDRKKVEVAREAQARGIPATPLLTPAEVLANEHSVARGSFRRLEVAEGLEAEIPSGFFTIDGERAGPRTRPPRAGEHGDAGFAARSEPAGVATDGPAAAADGHPLRGLRVLDFGIGAAGVEVGRLLAEYGAEVIKVETRRAPDFIRIILGSFMNPCFASSNRSKLGFGVNLKSEAGRALVMRLVELSDVTIENNGTGVMERLGLGPAALHAINPRIVSFSSQMLGSSGPWKDWIGYGPSTHPVCGLQYLWNYPEDADRPAGSTNIHPDHLVGRLGAFAVLAGLIRRQRTQRGMHADAAQFEAALGLLGDLLAQESVDPGAVRPQGNASPRAAPWGCYRCAGEDEWCVVNVGRDGEWAGLRAALGDPEWARREEYARAEGRVAKRAEIDRQLEAWTATRRPREVMETLQAHGVPAGIVAHAAHHFEDPHLGARGYRRPLDQPGIGPILVEGPAFRGSDLPEPIVKPAPRLGEHTREIASRLLGLSDAEIAEQIEAGVLEDPPD